MLKKQLLVLVLIAYVQSTSGFLATLAAIISGTKMVVEFIEHLPFAVHSVKEVIASVTGGKPASREDRGPGTAVQGPAAQGPAAQGPATQGPATQGPATQGPAAQAPAVQNPAVKTPRAEDTGIKNLTHTIEKYHDEIMHTFEEIDLKVDSLRLTMSDGFMHIEELIQNLPQQINMMMRKETMGHFIVSMNRKWERFMHFIERGVDAAIYSHEMHNNLRNIDSDLIEFRASIIPAEGLSATGFGLLTDLAEIQKKKRHSLCNGDASHHSVINIFQIIISTEVKAFNLQVLAFNEAFSENNGWKQLLKQSVIEFNQQLDRYLSDLRNALKIERIPSIIGCHSKEYYKVGENLDRLHTITPGRAPCWGRHQRAVSDGVFPIRVYRKLPPEAVSSLSLKCPKGLKSELRSVWYCDCLTFNKFILATMQSRVNDNYVVVAMRFQKHENYIYIQIAEGKLETNGYISDYSWVVPTQKRNGDNPFEASISIGERQIMFLGDLQLPPGYILAGIKIDEYVAYNRPEAKGEFGFRPLLYGVKFDYETGKLSQEQGSMNRPSPMSRYESQYTNMAGHRDPSQYTAAILGTDDKPLNSSRELPNFNAAAVLPNPLLPLGGVGVFYVITPNNIPLLSLRLFAIDYTIFMDGVKRFNLCASMTLPGEEKADDDSSCTI